MLLRRFGFVLCLTLWASGVMAEDMKVTITTDFPGGNVLVEKNDGSTVHLAPDLRGGRPWFYWHFQAEAVQPGRVMFIFANSPRIGVRGPAISRDAGKTWQWLGAEHVEYASPPGSDEAASHDAFHYEFTEPHLKVRFAVAIPYVQQDLDAFLQNHAANPHLRTSVLTRTLKGRPVELLQVGEPGPGVQAVLVTARHHACESMASYVLEGFLQEALSASPAGRAFRKKYVLHCVPIVDKDGVQEGDQGKWRHPHDHNRDYGRVQRYPEVKAIQELADARHVQYTLDLHCPGLRGDVHEAFYFDGLAIPHNHVNVNELIGWLREERPPAAHWPLNFLKPPPVIAQRDNLPNSHYFAYQDGVVMAATLEVPYTQPNCPLDAALARQYGATLLRAWVRTTFVTAASDGSRNGIRSAELTTLRNEFQRSYRGSPQEAEQRANAVLRDATTPALYRVEAHNQLALLRLQQKRFAEGLQFCDAVLEDAHASTEQRATAFLQRMKIVTSDPESTPDAVDVCLALFRQFPYPSAEQQARMFGAVSEFYEGRQNHTLALNYAQQQLQVAAAYEQGKVLNRIAVLYESLRQPEQAVAARQQAVAVLRRQLDPVPMSIFGAMMAADLFEALIGLPTATLDEKREAATMVLDHKVAPTWLKERVRKTSAELDKK